MARAMAFFAVALLAIAPIHAQVPLNPIPVPMQTVNPVLASPIVDWLNLLQAHIRLTSPMQHQQAGKYLGGLALSIYNVLKCNRNGTVSGVPEIPDEYAVPFAAYTFMNFIYPTYSFQHDALMKKQLATATDDIILLGRKFGQTEANKILRKSIGDGFSQYSGFVLPAPTPGVYRYTPGQTFLMLPQFGYTVPYILSAPQLNNMSDYYLKDVLGLTGTTGVPYFGSAEYYADLAFTQAYGNATSSARVGYDAATPDFWNDALGTSTLPGHYLNISYQIVPQSATLLEQAKFFAAFMTAMSDASIPCFRVKYTALLWRPWTAILTGDGATNPATGQPYYTTDASWMPYLAQPPHPSYPSGHSCISGAGAKVLALYAQSDVSPVTIWIGSEGNPAAGLRSFNSFSDLTTETGKSRLLGGLHYKKDCDDGMYMGADVATLVFNWFANDQ